MDKNKNNSKIIQLDVGGQSYATTAATLTKYPASLLANNVNAYLKSESSNSHFITMEKEDKPGLFIDRDGAIFRYILDFLRRSEGSKDWIKNMIPNCDLFRLRQEAQFYGLKDLTKEIDATSECTKSLSGENKKSAAQNHINTETVKNGPLSDDETYYISIGCRGYYSAERDNPANDMTKFRKITRITVSGRSDVAKEVFREELNESRDPDRYPPCGYTCRYYLTHTYLEYAFETLAKKGFELVTSFSTGNQTLPSSNKDEFKQWSTYVEYLFYKKSMVPA